MTQCSKDIWKIWKNKNGKMSKNSTWNAKKSFTMLTILLLSIFVKEVKKINSNLNKSLFKWLKRNITLWSVFFKKYSNFYFILPLQTPIRQLWVKTTVKETNLLLQFSFHKKKKGMSHFSASFLSFYKPFLKTFKIST